MALFRRSRPSSRSTAATCERAAVELAKEWRTDRVLRRLEAFLVVADRESRLPPLRRRRRDRARRRDRGRGQRRALTRWPRPAPWPQHTALDAPTLAAEAMKIAAEICIYTNDQIAVEIL